MTAYSSNSGIVSDTKGLMQKRYHLTIMGYTTPPNSGSETPKDS